MDPNMNKYRLSDSRLEKFLAEGFEVDVADFAYRAFLLDEAIDAAEELVDLIEEVSFVIDPEAFNEHEERLEYYKDDIYGEDREDYDCFKDWIKELRDALPRKGDHISAFFGLDSHLKQANENYLWRGPEWRSLLIRVADKLQLVQKATIQLPKKERLEAQVTEVDEHDAVPVDSLFDVEIRRATELLDEAKKPASGSAQSVPEIAQSAMERALSVALSEWADPNQRCAAITIAVALIVCPGDVNLSKQKAIKVSESKEIQACYRGVELLLPKKGVETRLWFFLDRCSLGWATGRASPAHLRLDDLAVSYLDAERNKKCLAHLREYLDVNGSQIAMAAVLGLAWLWLQRRERDIRKILSDQSGYTMMCDDPKLGIRVQGKKIVEAWYQGDRWSEESM